MLNYIWFPLQIPPESCKQNSLGGSFEKRNPVLRLLLKQQDNIFVTLLLLMLVYMYICYVSMYNLSSH